MPHVCLLYSPGEGQVWQDYFTKLLNKSDLKHVSCSVADTLPNLAKAFSESCVVVAILTMDLLDRLLDPKQIVCDKLNEHQSVAVISWSNLAEEFNKVKDKFSNSSKWRELSCDGSLEQCHKVVADLSGIVDEQEKSTKKKKHKRKKLEIIPDRAHKFNEKIAIIFNEEPSGTVQIKMEGGDFIDCRRHNRQAYTFKSPLHDFGVTKLSVYVDGNMIHQCPFTYQTPSLEAFRSISFLSQALGLNKDNTKELDKKLVEIYEASLPADLTLHRAANIHMMSNKAKRSDYGIPTLLHFAAQYGLTDLCCAVLDTPGSLAAFHIENKDGLDPAQIADKEGFSELANFIRMFIETAAVIEVSDELYLSMTGDHLYSNKSDISEESLQMADTQEKLHVSKPKKKLPPIPNQKKQQPKSILLEQPIMEEPEEPKPETPKKKPLPPPPRVSRSTSDLTATGEDHKVVKPSPSLSSIPKTVTKESPRQETVRRGSFPECPVTPADFMGMSGPGLNVKRSPGSLGSSSMDELIEIQRGVSEKEFSVDEAERLYSAWKERNRSLKMSIKDRQKGLEEMRNTYASVITQAKSRGERRSLFDRIKDKMGGRKSSKEEENIYQPKIKHTTYERVTDWSHNRTSTLSSSSSSSGGSRDSRVSISSQDSVYHSSDTDSEEETSVQKRGETVGRDKFLFSKTGQIVNKHLDVNRRKVYSMAKRFSYKDQYLQQALSEIQEGPPPVPPRGSRPS
ncbi:uncharacterized protein LOC111121405 isoform X2 [Crassostrea virginica]